MHEAMHDNDGKTRPCPQERKGTLDEDKRRIADNKRVDCGKAQFASLGVYFKVAADISEVLEK